MPTYRFPIVDPTTEVGTDKLKEVREQLHQAEKQIMALEWQLQILREELATRPPAPIKEFAPGVPHKKTPKGQQGGGW